MSGRTWPLLGLLFLAGAPGWADDEAPPPLYGEDQPVLFATPALALEKETLLPEIRAQQADVPRLMMQAQEQSVFTLPPPKTEGEGANTGGVHLDIKVSYLSDYVYRGVKRSEFIGDVTSVESGGNANFQFDGKLQFDLGKLPHPFIGIFANVLDSDPISNFQEVRPFFGMEWRIRPVVLTIGNNTYTFPDRTGLNTSEAFLKLVLDDAVLLRRDEPLLSPYVYAAYDYDLFEGWYFEAGVSHTFVIEGTSISLIPQAAVAYVEDNPAFAGRKGKDSGFQHYEFGLTGRYTLNTLLNIPQRYGLWSVNGYLFYTDSISDDLRADSGLWGGVGVQLQY